MGYEVIFETTYAKDWEIFKLALDKHIAESLDDAIGWGLLNPKEFNNIANGYYVWKKPNMIKCPQFYILVRIDETEKKVHALRFVQEIP